MADSSTPARPAIIMTSEQAGARLLADEMAEMRKHPLDTAKVRGGIFARADGTLQNAEGQPVDEAGKVLGAAPASEAANAPASEDEKPAAKRE